MPTAKGAARRDIRGWAAPEHRVCTSMTDDNQLQKQGSYRRKSSGQSGGTGSRLLRAVCQPGNGAPGLCWKPLGESRAADRYPTVSWVCQGRSLSPLSSCTARGSPDPGQHQARPPANTPSPRAPKSLAQAPLPLQQTSWPPASQGAPGIRKAAAQLKQLLTQSGAPLPLTCGDQELRNRLWCIIPCMCRAAEPASDSDSHCSARDTPEVARAAGTGRGSSHICSRGAVKHLQRKSQERRREVQVR